MDIRSLVFSSMVLINLFFSFKLVQAAQFTQADPTWLTSPYFRANNQPVINVKTGNSSTPRYTFTFSSALPGVPNLAYGIKGYKGDDYFGQQYFEIRRQDLTASTFSVAIQIFGVTNLWILNVAYIAVDPNFPHHLNSFDNVPLNYSQGDLTNITVKQTYETTYTNIINYTLQAGSRKYTKFQSPLSSNKILFFLTSLFINSDFRIGTTLFPVNITVAYEILSQTTYSMKAYVYQTTSITRLHFSQIVFNSYDVLRSNKYYLVYEVWITDKYGGFKQIPQQFVDNFIMGLKDLRTIDGRCGINYQWNFETVSGVFGVKLYQSDFWHVASSPDGCSLDEIRNTVFYMKTWECPPSHIYFNLSSNKCQDGCGDRFFQDIQLFVCESCHYTCYTCQGASSLDCHTCNDADNRILINNDSCQCKEGYFDNGIGLACIQCPSITGCLKCFFNLTTSNFGCLVCEDNWFLNQYTCEEYESCNSSMNLFLNMSVNSCQQCELIGCRNCQNLQKCAQCNAIIGYYLNQTSRLCQLNRCGDKILTTFEQCDDGNTVSGDGCSSQCQIQKSWTCPIYYCCQLMSKAIVFELISYQKTINKNQFTFSIQINAQIQDLSLYKNQISNPKIMNTVPSGGEITSIYYNQQQQKLEIKMKYNQNLGFPFDIVFKVQIPPPRSDCNFQLYQITINIDQKPSNNLAPVFYTEQQYKTSQRVATTMFSMSIVSWLILIWSIFSGKIIGLELIGVFQLAFFDLANHNELNLMLSGLLNIDFVNGLNINTFLKWQQQSNIPSRIQQLNYSQSLLYNYNFMLFAHIFIMTTGIVFYTFFKRFLQILPHKLFSVLNKSLKQAMITITLFNCLNFAFALGLSCKYGSKSGSSALFTVQCLLLTIQAIFYLAIIIMILNQSLYLGQFLNCFKPNKFCRIYIAITLCYRIVLGFYIAFTNENQIFTLLVMGLAILYLLYHFVHLPFKSKLHNYRSSTCHLAITGILFITMYYRSFKSTTDLNQRAKLFSPAYIELSMLLICEIVSIGLLVFETIKMLKKLKLMVYTNTEWFNNLPLSETKIHNQTTMKTKQDEKTIKVEYFDRDGNIALQ